MAQEIIIQYFILTFYYGFISIFANHALSLNKTFK